ncbi:MAG: cytochrome c biogenesis protein CcsA [Deltaproteobacteria bacterium]|nr:cytochrome c biogenesis protein CcsA [Deltaproteobacteria bacterium]
MHLSCILGVMTFYLGATLVYLFQYIFKKNFNRVAYRILAIGFLLHTLLLFYYLFRNQYPFFVSANYSLHFVSWVILLFFLVFSRKLRLEAAGPLFIPTALLFYLISLLDQEAYRFSATVLKSPWALAHLIAMFLAFSLFLLGLGMATAFVLQQARLKNQKAPYLRLPSLEALDQMHSRTSAIGFGLLTLGILAGFGLSKGDSPREVLGSFFMGDQKQWGAWIAWIVYLAFLNLHSRSRWRGRRALFLSLLGVAVIALTFLGFKHGVN